MIALGCRPDFLPGVKWQCTYCGVLHGAEFADEADDVLICGSCFMETEITTSRRHGTVPSSDGELMVAYSDGENDAEESLSGS